MVQGETRPLSYPLYYSETIEESIIDDSSLVQTLEGFFPDDPDERAEIVIQVSLNEFVALASSVDVGRDIAYGTGAIEIWWIWSRMVYATFCEKVLDCILTEADIQNAIAQYAQTGGVTPTTPENETILAASLINDPPDCDNDIIFGMTTQLVEFTDSICRDILEQIEAFTQASGALAYLISAIPVVESLPLDEAVGFSNWLANQIYGAYIAASTEPLRIQVACDLFCMAQANGCELSFEQARDYFYENVGVTLDLSDPTSFLNDLIANNLLGTAAFYAMFTLVFQMYAFGETILGTRWQTFVNIVNAMFNDPNPDWDTLCDCGWEYTFNFATDDGGFVPIQDSGNNRGQYIASTGWGTTDIPVAATFRRGLFISKTFVDTEITKIEMTFNFTKGSPVTGTQSAYGIYHYLNGVLQQNDVVLFNDSSNGTDKVLTFTFTDTIDEIRLLVTSSSWTSATYTGSALLKSVKIYGNGDNPFD